MKLKACLHILIIIICGIALFGCEPQPPMLCKSYPPVIKTPQGKLELASHKMPVKQLSAAPIDPECMSRSQQASKLYSQMLYWENGKVKPCLTYAELVRQKRMMLEDELAKNCVQIEQVGETFRVIMPSDKLFNLGTANISSSYYCTLQNLAKWMKTYTISTVEVSGYSDQCDHCCSCALTRRQAQVIMDYLWSCGIDARLAYAIGYDGHEPITPNCNLADRAANRRVELNFKIVPPICAIIY